MSIVNEIFNELLKRIVKLTLETTPQDIEGWDSMFQAQLIEKLEQRFSIKFKLREILLWDSVEDIIGSIKSHLE